MVIKTFIAASCAAVLAGGMVYFSTSPANSEGSIELGKPAIAPNANPKSTSKPVNSNTADDKKDAQKPSILRRYVDKDESPKAIETPKKNPYTIAENEAMNSNGDAQSKPENRLVAELEHPHPRPKAGESKKAVKEGDKAKTDKTEAKRQNKISETASANNPKPETEPVKAQTPKPQTIRPPLQVPHQAQPALNNSQKAERAKAKKPINPRVSHDDPAKIRIDTVFEQAEQIEQPDLKDRAYLDLSDYATNKGMFDDAQRAALKINQPELRDTARSRIAMGMARYGMSDEAFDLIEQVEIQELRDVMRLQVIEALLGTDIRR